MRITKDADERRMDILDAAETLFSQKGFDATTISDIIEKLGVARGTVYYYFKSKEDVMDALLERMNTRMLTAARTIAEDKSIAVPLRLFKTIAAMSMSDNTGVLTHIHKPQNALMHQKTHRLTLEGIPPVLMDIIQDGIEQGLFSTPYPYETLEMIIAHVNTVFDGYAENLPEEEQRIRVEAFLFNLERLFGAVPGTLGLLKKLFYSDEGNRANEYHQ